MFVQAFRPDRVIAAGHLFVCAVLGESFTQSAERELDLGDIGNVKAIKTLIELSFNQKNF